MILRQLAQIINEKIGKGRAIILIGPRQVGKTTLVKSIIGNAPYLFLDVDDPTVRAILTNPNTEEIKNIIANNTLLFIDEAQRIQNIGITLKIIIDQFPNVQLLVSGSSAFELKDKINEPLTGRKWLYQLFPISWKEFEDNVGYIKAAQQLEIRLIYGMYPAVINGASESFEILKELTSSYLYKDILAVSNIRKPEILEKLLQALALQIGNEVSYNELSQLLGIDKNTVGNYIDMLEKAYIIFKLKPFSANLRNEIKSNQKIYFYDNGIRNMVIGNLNPLGLRQDKGSLWENFLISEKVKKNNYENRISKSYFWRTKQQQEIDYVEELAGKLTGYEMKWNENAKVKKATTFTNTYNTTIEVINKENFRNFIC